ncbi:MAG: type III pantothenate kinase [bacterium]|nr:type III pantothenate kinase [bacterium]
MSLVYYFDVGNTRVKFWRCRNEHIEARASVAHGGSPEAAIIMLPALFAEKPDAILGGSVMGEQAMIMFTRACEKMWLRSPCYARSSARQAGVTNAYGEGSTSLGVDRWLGLLAARAISGDVCVVDCGTAVTMDVLRRDGLHLGGYILPGLGLMSDALMRETDRVRFTVSMPATLALGRSTSEAVTNGVMMAVVSMIERVAREHCTQLILTGGDADSVSHLLSIPHVVEPELLLHGLQRYFADAGIR